MLRKLENEETPTLFAKFTELLDDTIQNDIVPKFSVRELCFFQQTSKKMYALSRSDNAMRAIFKKYFEASPKGTNVQRIFVTYYLAQQLTEHYTTVNPSSTRIKILSTLINNILEFSKEDKTLENCQYTPYLLGNLYYFSIIKYQSTSPGQISNKRQARLHFENAIKLGMLNPVNFYLELLSDYLAEFPHSEGDWQKIIDIVNGNGDHYQRLLLATNRLNHPIFKNYQASINLPALIEQGINANHPDCLWRFGMVFIGENNIKQGLKHLKNAAAQTTSHALQLAGLFSMYPSMRGPQMQRNIGAANAYLRLAADKGSCIANYKLGTYYLIKAEEKNNYSGEDMLLAIGYLKNGTEMIHDENAALCADRLATIYNLNKSSLTTDPDQHLYWLNKATELKDHLSNLTRFVI